MLDFSIHLDSKHRCHESTKLMFAHCNGMDTNSIQSKTQQLLMGGNHSKSR